MDNNIFEGAKFGDKFVTRNGDLAIFIGDDNHVYKLFIEDYDVVFCDEFGRYKGYGDSNLDIVSKYQESINEKELDEFAKEYVLTMSGTMGYYDDIQKISDGLQVCIDMFKTGYRNAKYGIK